MQQMLNQAYFILPFLSPQLADVITAVALYMAVKEYNKQVVRTHQNTQFKYLCVEK